MKKRQMAHEAATAQGGIFLSGIAPMADFAPSHRPAIQTACQAKRLNAPVSWSGIGKCVTRTTRLCTRSRRPNWASSHTNPLAARILLQPFLTDTERISGEKKRNVTYIGRMSRSGGQ